METTITDFTVPAPQTARNILAHHHGLEVMYDLSEALFTTRPQIVREHWRNSRFCNCVNCNEYFGE